MASWRVPGSILEAPGLDFGRFWGRFFEIFDRFWLRVFEMVVHRRNAKNAKKAKNAENAGTAKNLPKQELDHRRAKSGWAAVLPPPGGFNGIEANIGRDTTKKLSLSFRNRFVQ